MDCFPLGSFGQSIRATIVDNGSAVDISAATNLKLIFQPPGGERPIEKTASLISGGTTGIMGYTVEDGFFDARNRKLIGTWSFQPAFVLGDYNGAKGASINVHKFKVVDRLSKP